MMKGARRYFGLPDDTPAKSSFDPKAEEQSHEQATSDERTPALSGWHRLLRLLTGRGETHGQQR
jgi:hypothetical protein